MRIAWATDIHLNSADADVIERFCVDIHEAEVEAVLLGGDIAEAAELFEWLEFLESRLKLPIYYVLGNHDFYGSDIATVRKGARCFENPRVSWLPAVGRTRLGDAVSLVGHDGWGDCRIGAIDNFEILTDYLAIEDLSEQVDRDDLLRGFSRRAPLRNRLRELGDEAAAELRGPLMEAVAKDSAVLVLTHVPPFREACYSEETWLPGFTCKAVGDLLLEAAETEPDTKITVLCGHRHRSGYVQMLPNLEVYTGHADYGSLFFHVLEVGSESVRMERFTT